MVGVFIFVAVCSLFCWFPDCFVGLFYYLQMRHWKGLFYLDFQRGHQLAAHFVEE